MATSDNNVTDKTADIVDKKLRNSMHARSGN